ncbi:MAG TPA: fibro-slime domain-containing protein [Kofleriaceae bacterium]|nr:fibro-slime domain-containing protein [Kofleriaceae bacterium]
MAACGGGAGDGGDGDQVDAPGSGDPPVTGCGQLLATIRDFSDAHPDFEEPDGFSDVSRPGLVEPLLGADGTPVYAPDGPVEPHTAGRDEFHDWYHDVPGTNRAYPYVLDLNDQGGTWVFDSAAFFPVDGTGLGNEGRAHNFHFTTEIHTIFQYRGGEKFSFRGDDDLWLFVNGRLALDLGGLHPALPGTIDLDAQAAALGIERGRAYTMDIFHAERHTDASNFRIETTIDCFIVP